MIDSKKDVVDLLLKASGLLEYCVNYILVQVPIQVRYAYYDLNTSYS
jgi:hypothetical protein